jgi:hypothetical protein
MALIAAVVLWAIHGMILWWNWGGFRPRVALLHGLGMAAVAGVLLWLGLPGWALSVAGAAIGGVGGWGHRLAPGLFFGLLFAAVVPFLLGTGAGFVGLGAFALAAQAAAGLASLTKSAF